MKRTNTYYLQDWKEVEAMATLPCTSFILTYNEENVPNKKFILRLTKEVEDE